MKNKKLLAIILLSLSLCFVSGVGYGEVDKHKELRDLLLEYKAPQMETFFLNTRIKYIMENPFDFLDVYFAYDQWGTWPWGDLYHGKLPRSVDTKDKLIVVIRDNRGEFSYKSTKALLELFKKHLKAATWFTGAAFPNMDTDIVAEFYSRDDIFLGYFYQGEYHLWEE